MIIIVMTVKKLFILMPPPPSSNFKFSSARYSRDTNAKTESGLQIQ